MGQAAWAAELLEKLIVIPSDERLHVSAVANCKVGTTRGHLARHDGVLLRERIKLDAYEDAAHEPNSAHVRRSTRTTFATTTRQQWHTNSTLLGLAQSSCRLSKGVHALGTVLPCPFRAWRS